jgi:NADH:ubiquinone oxidoreductase subunit B-like Fe-S oxidoreductase
MISFDRDIVGGAEAVVNVQEIARWVQVVSFLPANSCVSCDEVEMMVAA